MRLQEIKTLSCLSIDFKRCAMAAALLAAGMSFSSAHANEKTDALKAKLAEAERLLQADKSSHEDTAEKKKAIDDKLAARQQREAEIMEELKALCEEQEKLKPGSLDACLAKLGN